MTHDSGNWNVEINEVINGEMVELSLAEMDDEGIKAHVAYLPPDTAIEMGEALIRNANWIKENT